MKIVNVYKEKYTVYGGRNGKINPRDVKPKEHGWLGNPHSVGQCNCGKFHKRGEAIDAFAEYFANRIENDPEYKAAIAELKNETVGCFCRPKACHLDIVDMYLKGKEYASH
jgi:hypothetical protein